VEVLRRFIPTHPEIGWLVCYAGKPLMARLRLWQVQLIWGVACVGIAA